MTHPSRSAPGPGRSVRELTAGDEIIVTTLDHDANNRPVGALLKKKGRGHPAGGYPRN